MSPLSATVTAPPVDIANGPVPSPSESVLPEMIVTVTAVPSVIAAVTTESPFEASSSSEADASAMDRPTSVTDDVNVCVAPSLVPSSMMTVNS